MPTLRNVQGPNDHAQARVLLNEAWKSVQGTYPSVNELNAAQTIASLETVYGRAGQFAALANQGKYNWGALQRQRNPDGSCPGGTAPGLDALNPNAVNPRCFYFYPSDFEAAKAFLRSLTVSFPIRARATLAAMKTGDLLRVAQAMKYSDPAHAYFELDADAYGQRLLTRSRQIFSQISAASTPAYATNSNTNFAGLVLGVVALGTGIWYFLTKR